MEVEIADDEVNESAKEDKAPVGTEPSFDQGLPPLEHSAMNNKGGAEPQ